MITEKVDARSKHYKQRILKEDGLFKGPPAEVDLSHLVRQWKSQFNKKLLKETLNLIHVKETELIKRDLQRGIKIIEENTNALGSSDGFSNVGKKLGLNKSSIFMSKSQPKLIPQFYKSGDDHHLHSYSKLKEERNQDNENGLQKIDKVYERIKEIQNKRDAKIIWMKERVKIKDKKLKKLEEKQSKKYEKYEEKRKASIKKKEEEMKERAKQRMLREKEYREVLKKKPKYEEINENFNSTLEMSVLEKKKQALASLRNLHKPIDFKKVEEEQLKKERELKERNDEYRLKLAERIKKNQETYNQEKFSTRYYEKVIEENQE